MIDTPWGPADELRSRKLSPGPGESRQSVARNQRERLYGATVAVIAERGYESARVADILEVAGVSRSAFYAHFDNKLECFIATLGELLERAGRLLATTYSAHQGSWDDRLAASLDALMGMVVAQPAAARLCFVEAYAAGPEAIEYVERIGDDFLGLAVGALQDSPERTGMPRNLIRALLGGIRHVIHTRLRHGREAELTKLAPELLDWALGYRTPPRPLRRPRKPPARPPTTPDPDEQRERILAAVTNIVAQNGYQAMTVTEIAQRAGVSLTTFYALFDDKAHSFLAAIDDGERQLLEATLPVYGEAPDWPTAVRDGLHAMFAFLATNAATAQLGGSDIYAGGPKALERHEASVSGFQTLLEPGHAERPEVSAITTEAIGGAVSALLYERLRIKGPERLYEMAPSATFLTLAPFLGAERACELANEGWHPPAPA